MPSGGSGQKRVGDAERPVGARDSDVTARRLRPGELFRLRWRCAIKDSRRVEARMAMEGSQMVKEWVSAVASRALAASLAARARECRHALLRW